MNRIVLEAVPQSAMRPPYDQETGSGDWFYDDAGDLVIRSIGTDLDDPETFLYALHELVEAMLCRADGVSQEAVDRFDAAHATTLDHDPDAEPGDHPAAPYRRQHRRAMLIEMLMAEFLGLTGYGTVR
jgi:aryl-alcohol dehydrogenase-like predicted oxidoreductase